jgi:hypothetical protein
LGNFPEAPEDKNCLYCKYFILYIFYCNPIRMRKLFRLFLGATSLLIQFTTVILQYISI